jgi:V-type H+-transporting ATPase subunit C
MVVLYFSIANTIKSIRSNKEFVTFLKQNILNQVDHKKITAFDLKTMRDLLTDNLDNLLKINDELIKTDQDFESYLKKLEKRIIELDPKCDIQINVKGSNYKIEDAISVFNWDDGRYPKKQKSISDILSKINEKYTQTFQNLKSKNDEYVRELTNLKAKQKGLNEALSLMKIDYREIVKTNLDKMIETDYLCTMLCFVPVNQEKLFKEKYFELCDGMVLPASAKRIDQRQDDKICLYRVVVMKHVKDTFKQQLQSNLRCSSREYNAEEINLKPQEEEEINNLTKKVKELKTTLVRNSLAGYSEVYYALLHLKYLRLYVESNLKYANNDYLTCIVFCNQGKEQKIVSTMIKKFSDSNEAGWYGTKEELKESEDFYPFILIKLGVPSYI